MTDPKPKPTATQTDADDLVDAGSEMSFPASDPPSYMAGTAVAGPPPEDADEPREPVTTEVGDTAAIKPVTPMPRTARKGRGGAEPDRGLRIQRMRIAFPRGPCGILAAVFRSPPVLRAANLS